MILGFYVSGVLSSLKEARENYKKLVNFHYKIITGRKKRSFFPGYSKETEEHEFLGNNEEEFFEGFNRFVDNEVNPICRNWNKKLRRPNEIEGIPELIKKIKKHSENFEIVKRRAEQRIVELSKLENVEKKEKVIRELNEILKEIHKCLGFSLEDLEKLDTEIKSEIEKTKRKFKF